MKTILALTVVAGLCLPVPAMQRSTENLQTEFNAQSQTTSGMLIGTGRIKAKSGNNFVVESDDENIYLAEVVPGYAVGDHIIHTDPVNGWIEIIGRAD